MSQKRAPVVLLILDGWGYKDEKIHNAIAYAQTPVWDSWWKEPHHHTLLEASGLYVGLPAGQMGNSEVGHIHIGAGRVLMQDYTRINASIDNGDFFKNPAINQVITTLQAKGKALHIMGLFSNGGVHSHEKHVLALLKLCAHRQFNTVYLHLFLDGRDTPPQSALQFFEKLETVDIQGIQIASVTGRYYAMDRDKRWERIEPVYNLLTENQSSSSFDTPKQAILSFYEQDITDEFIPPTRIKQGKAIEDGDAVLFFNFRSDRARQLTEAFINPDFSGFMRKKIPVLSAFVSMTEYAKNLKTTIAFPDLIPENTLGEIVAQHHLKQLRIAETEKYAHVTFFFNGGLEKVFPGEDRVLIPSLRIPTYDLQPEMSAPALTDALVKAINSQQYAVIICNYANADMVGHTGDFQAAIKAIECLDACMGRVWEALEKQQGYLVVSADHGNAEIMFDESTQQPHTAHTCQPVPFLLKGSGWKVKDTKQGSLIDIAPSILALLDIEQPVIMTGRSLLIKDKHVKKQL